MARSLLRCALAALAATWVIARLGCAGGEELTPPTQPVERLGHPAWAARHEALLQRSKGGAIDVVFIGDSITHFWEYDGPQVWEKTFAPLKSGNYGIAGDRTGHVLWRITTGKELEGISPRVAVLLIGTNNLSAGDTPAQAAEGVEAIVKELRRQKPAMKVLVLGIFPRSAGASDAIRERIRETNGIISRLADGEGVFYKDIGGEFLDGDSRLSEEVMPDYLHLGARGYEIWARAVRSDVERLAQR